MGLNGVVSAVPECLEPARRIEALREAAARFAEQYVEEYLQLRERLDRRQLGLTEFNDRRAVALERYAALLREQTPLIRRYNAVAPVDRPRLREPELLPLLVQFIVRCPRLQRSPAGPLRPASEAIPERLLRVPEPTPIARENRRRRCLSPVRGPALLLRRAGNGF